MYFNATPTNMVAVLVSSLAFVGVFKLIAKRYDSNVPLLFYIFAVPFTSMFERPIHPAILYGGLGFVLLLRFEFMGPTFSKLIAFFANAGLCIMIWMLLSETTV
jgi:hypothetical protein